MDTIMTGRLLARKRKEQNLTQEQLAEQLGVSNKTVSKWETGRTMPDYALVPVLCRTLGITVGELLDGKEAEGTGVREEQLLDLLKRTQALEKQQRTFYGVLLIVMGLAMLAVSHTLGGSDFWEFVSGLFLGLAVAEMLAGLYVIGRSLQ